MGYILKRNPDFSANILKVNRNNNPLINETLLQMKYARVIGLLAKQLEIPHSRALEIFYSSDTYRYLEQGLYHLHNMSEPM